MKRSFEDFDFTVKTILPLRFIGEPVVVWFVEPPALEKKPPAPAGFTWKDNRFQIVEVLSEWHDYRRTGRMSRNMQPAHAEVASHRGSWGVGQDYYRVRTSAGRLFDLYFDRAPRGIEQRKGTWYLDRELVES